MVKIEFLGPIGVKPIELELLTLKDLSIYMSNDDNLKKWAKNSAVAVNDVIVSDIDYKLEDGDKVSVLPPVCGG